MNKFLCVFLIMGLVGGCATTKTSVNPINESKLPKGKWLQVNQEGFVPPNVDVYKKNGSEYVKQGSQLMQQSLTKGAE